MMTLWIHCESAPASTRFAAREAPQPCVCIPIRASSPAFSSLESGVQGKRLENRQGKMCRRNPTCRPHDGESRCSRCSLPNSVHERSAVSPRPLRARSPCGSRDAAQRAPQPSNCGKLALRQLCVSRLGYLSSRSFMPHLRTMLVPGRPAAGRTPEKVAYRGPTTRNLFAGEPKFRQFIDGAWPVGSRDVTLSHANDCGTPELRCHW